MLYKACEKMKTSFFVPMGHESLNLNSHHHLSRRLLTIWPVIEDIQYFRRNLGLHFRVIPTREKRI